MRAPDRMDVEQDGTGIQPGKQAYRFIEPYRSLALGRPELAPVDAALVGDGGGCDLQSRHRVACDGLELRAPELSLHRDALRDRCPFRKHTPEGGVAPVRWKIDEIVLVEISVDEPGECYEWQVVAIDRVGDEQRIAGRRFDRPEIIELDDKGV